jgi:phospholipase D3/4
VLHTKFLIADSTSLYLGSANWDWRSLSQIKELGIVVTQCSPMAIDLQKIFEIYWMLAGKNSLPTSYPAKLDTQWNMANYSVLSIGGAEFDWFFGASPLGFITPHRTNDWQALVGVIQRAEVHVSVSVMDYSPVTLYQPRPEYWGAIDNALREAAFRGVSVNLLFARWAHTPNATIQFMRSLAALDNVKVKLMEIPQGPGPVIPFTRVNHSKYMITDNEAYITTSNWTPDYFLHTGGVSICFKNVDFQADVQAIFDRDWNSEYSSVLEA